MSKARSQKPATNWMETQFGLKLAAAPGIGKESYPHVLSYRPLNKSSLFFAPLTARRLTVCFSFREWWPHVAWMLYATGIMVVCGYYAYPDGEFGKGHPCKGSNGVNIKMCQLNDNLEKSVGEFRFLIAFILAGFVARVVLMWATRRTNYAALCGSTRELCVLMASFLPHPTTAEATESTASARHTIARWILLAYELAVLKAKGLMDDESQGRTYLEELDLLHPGEWDALIAGDRHTTVYFWIQSYMTQLGQLGVVDTYYVMAFSQAIGRARAQANDLMSSLDRDLPFPYVNLCYILVCLNVLIFTTFKGVLWSTWLYQHGSTLMEQPVFWVDVAVTFAWNVSYTSLYQLCYLLYNPFGNSKIDVAHETIASGLRKLAKNLAQAQGFVPVELVVSAGMVHTGKGSQRSSSAESTGAGRRSTMTEQIV